MKILPGASGRFRLRAAVIAPLTALLALSVVGASWAASTSQSSIAQARHTTGTVTVKTGKVSGYGTVLVNAQGHALYIFEKDNRQHVTCTGSCAGYWPPLKQSGAHKAVAGGSAKASLISSDKDPAGGRVVTYSKWPLYAYVGDHTAGTAKGEGLNISGGKWYVISPSGKVIKSKTSGGGSGGGGWG